MTRATFYNHRYIIIPLVIFWIVSIILLLNMSKGDELLFLARNRNWVLDEVFSSITQLAELPVYLIIIVVLFVVKRKEKAMTILSIGLITTLISWLLKEFFQEPRPSLYFDQIGMLKSFVGVPGVVLHSGHSSYPSGHTMSAFSLFFTLALLWPTKKWFGVFCVVLGILVGVSRIYLGQHFLSDVVSGSMVGTYLAAFADFFLYKMFIKRKQKRLLHNQ